jgi:hypothetical protein
VVNPSARTRSGLAELWLPAPIDAEPPVGSQRLELEPAETTYPLASASRAMMAIREMEWQRAIAAVAIRDPAGDELLRIERTRFGELVTPDVQRRLDELVASRPEGEVLVVEHRRARQRVLARAESVLGYGWSRWAPAPLRVEPVEVDAAWGALSNGLVTVRLDPRTATFAIDGLEGLGRLVDGGDVGDTYNYCPPADDLVVDRPVRAEVELLEAGPLRGRLALRATYAWPERAEADRRIDPREVEVRTVVELRAGERLVRVETTFDNRCRDHRLRAWFPLPKPAATSTAECAFAVVERGLTAEGGATETAMPTYPSRRFVQAGGLTIVHEGLLEYELVDVDVDVDGGRASSLALTLLRSTGLLSQGPMATRPLPAGPVVPAEAAQLQGPVAVRYAVLTGPADPYALVDEAFLPLLAVEGTSRGLGEGERGQALAVDGAEVSALRRTAAGGLELRVFNPTSSSTTVTIRGRSGWLVDLRGRAQAPFADRFELGPWRIATAVIEDG